MIFGHLRVPPGARCRRGGLAVWDCCLGALGAVARGRSRSGLLLIGPRLPAGMRPPHGGSHFCSTQTPPGAGHRWGLTVASLPRQRCGGCTLTPPSPPWRVPPRSALQPPSADPPGTPCRPGRRPAPLHTPAAPSRAPASADHSHLSHEHKRALKKGARPPHHLKDILFHK